MQPDWLNASVQAAQLFDQNRFDEAENLAASALRENPEAAQAMQVLGFVALRRGRIRESMNHLIRALELRPDLAVSHNGLGCCYFRVGQLEKALYHYDRALILNPVYPIAHFSRAEVLLKTGHYKEGWVEYEWRWTSGLVRGPEIPRPRWDGSPLNGRSILIHSEQGVGDVLMIIRLLPLLKQMRARIVFACHKPLKAMLEPIATVDRWFPIDEPANIDFEIYSPLLSLPGLLGINESNLPREVPYIPIDKVRAEAWRQKLTDVPGFKVGICWQGSPTFEGDQFRSIPLKFYSPIAKVPNVSLISLQKGTGDEQIEPLKNEVPVKVIPNLDDEGAFLDTAAIMMNLDLIITSDTAIAHLAGALGRPVWVMLSTGCDWRWGASGSDSLWYPTMRLFRQKNLGEWGPVFAEIAAALAERVAGKEVIAPRREIEVHAPVSAGELLDKISILEIKRERIKDPAKLAHINRELDALNKARKESVALTAGLDEVVAELKQVNIKLWEIEDEIRLCEKSSNFSERFVELARAVYQNNDRRSELKKRINELLGSALVEEKSYA